MMKPTQSADSQRQVEALIPDIPGIKQMTPLEMNAVLFDKKHTVLTPALLDSLSQDKEAENG